MCCLLVSFFGAGLSGGCGGVVFVVVAGWFSGAVFALWGDGLKSFICGDDEK